MSIRTDHRCDERLRARSEWQKGLRGGPYKPIDAARRRDRPLPESCGAATGLLRRAGMDRFRSGGSRLPENRRRSTAGELAVEGQLTRRVIAFIAQAQKR